MPSDIPLLYKKGGKKVYGHPRSIPRRHHHHILRRLSCCCGARRRHHDRLAPIQDSVPGCPGTSDSGTSRGSSPHGRKTAEKGGPQALEHQHPHRRGEDSLDGLCAECRKKEEAARLSGSPRFGVGEHGVKTKLPAERRAKIGKQSCNSCLEDGVGEDEVCTTSVSPNGVAVEGDTKAITQTKDEDVNGRDSASNTKAAKDSVSALEDLLDKLQEVSVDDGVLFDIPEANEKAEEEVASPPADSPVTTGHEDAAADKSIPNGEIKADSKIAEPAADVVYSSAVTCAGEQSTKCAEDQPFPLATSEDVSGGTSHVNGEVGAGGTGGAHSHISARVTEAVIVSVDYGSDDGGYESAITPALVHPECQAHPRLSFPPVFDHIASPDPSGGVRKDGGSEPGEICRMANGSDVAVVIQPATPSDSDEEPPPLPASSPPPIPQPSTSAAGPLDEVKLSPRIAGGHRKSGSVSSSVSSSSDVHTASDLRGVSSPPSTPRTMSPGMSPLGSPSTMRNWNADALPVTLEKTIKIQKGNEQLGLSVEAVDKGINGCMVKAITKGAVSKDGRLQVGDYVTSVNNESMRRITNAQARAILRRATLLSTDISINYITAADAASHRGSVASPTPEHSPQHRAAMASPSVLTAVSDSGSLPSPPVSPAHGSGGQVEAVRSPPLGASAPTPNAQGAASAPRQKSLASDGSPAGSNQAWGPPRTVQLERMVGKSLGISIVGGRVDMFHISQEHTISGIFIKHVLEDSPAGRNGTLKTGDRILEVNGNDLRSATHDEAVLIIRNATTPVTFVVQSLSDSACVDNAEPKPEAIPESDGEDEDEYGYNPKKLQKKYGDLGGEVHLVELQRGGNGLGLSLAGNKDRNTMSVFVAGVQPDSTAAKDGRIRIGDELLEVNGQVLYGRSHLNASAIIKGINTPVVKIVLLRRDNYLDLMAVKPLKLGPAASPDEAPADVTGSPPSGHAPPPLPSSVPPARPEENAVPPPVTLDVVQTVVLQKGPQGLGFGIQEDTRDGRHGIYVRSITPGGIAAQDGQLAVGDQILEVGDRSLAGIQYDKAIDILRQTQGTVKLKIRKSGSVPQPAPGTTMILGSTVGESSTDTADTSDPKTCRIVAGKETLIEIEKGRTGLGLSIVGGADTLLGAIIIHEVYDDGAAARDGRLMAGDQILDVNGEDMRDATHERAIQVLRLTPSNVRMLVYRDDNEAREEDLYDIFTVELMKRPGKGLGLSIVGKKKDVGVYISDIVKGGVAEADGRLMQGDQILSVNGEDMRKASQEYAAGVLKTLMGKVTLQVGRLKAGSRASSRRNSNSPGSALKKSDSSSSSGRSRGKHSKSGSEDASHIRNVQVTQDAQGSLGISIAGGKGSILGDVPVIIASLSPNGPAMQSGKLREGDKILMVNGTLTDGLTCDEVITLLKSQPTVMLQVMQGEEMAVNVNSTGSMPRSRQVSADRSMEAVAQEMASDLEESHTSECRTVILNRGPEGLGFSIVGGHGSPHGDLPIYVKNVFSKGAAADSGQLKRGDQILAVNGQSLEGVTHDEAVNILKNIRGTVTLTIMS